MVVSANNSIKNEYKKMLTLLKIMFFFLKNKRQAIRAVTGIKKGRTTLLFRTGIDSSIQFWDSYHSLKNMRLVLM